MSNQLTLSNSKEVSVAKRIDDAINAVVQNQSSGFEMIYIQASAISIIEEALTEEFMKPIMKLMGKKIGFKADKPDYKWEIVRNCVIEARFTGLQVTGNHFNIISGNMYVTKEGYSYLLQNIQNLMYDIIFDIPKKQENKVVVTTDVSWTHKGASSNKKLTFVIKSEGGGDDAFLGKAERKAKKWLYEQVTGKYISDGEVEIQDINHTVVNEKETPKQQIQPEPKNEVPIVDLASENKVEKSKRQLEAEKYVIESSSLEELEKRVIRARTVSGGFDESVYEETKSKFNGN